MATTYSSKYFTGQAVDGALDLAVSAVQPEDVAVPTGGGQADGLMTHEDKAKLDGIETGATADQTAQEIATAINADATAETTLKSALGLGTAAYTASTAYAPATGSTVYAPLASPALTGNPTAPTATQGNNTTNLATTAFVNAEIAADAAPIAHVGATGAAHGHATTSVAGFMSATDKTKLNDMVNVKDYGAVGSGSVDDGPAFQNAINYVLTKAPIQPAIFIPSGNYRIDTTLSVIGSVYFKGEGFSTIGTRIFAGATLNAPVFNVSANARFFNLSIIGSDNSANTNETLVTIDGANDVTFESVFFYNSYVAVKYTGTTPAFYNSYSNCTFTNTNNFFVVIDNSSSAGVDMIINHCRFLGKMIGGCWDFELGLGSIISSDVQISLSGGAPANSKYCVFGTPAPAFGGAQFTNIVFEGGGNSEAYATTVIYINGTGVYPWKEMKFNNCIIATGSSPALLIKYGNGLTFNNCTFSSLNDGIIRFEDGGSQLKNIFSDCTWQGSGAETCLMTDGDSVVECYISNPCWSGYGKFIDFTSIIAENSDQISLTVIGGSVSLSKEAILLSDYNNVNKNIQIKNSNYGPMQYCIYTGTLDGDGNVLIPHEISSGHSQIMSVNGFWKGGSGESYGLSSISVDGLYINMAGGAGAASRNYRVFVQYVQENVAWN